jgi:hypothetical protein
MKYLPIAWLSLLMIMTACSKDIDIFTPNDPLQLQQTKDSLAFAQFQDLAKPDAQRWTWDVTEAQNISISEEAYIQFPAAAFVDADQLPVSGDIDVTVTSSLTPGKLLLSNIACLADDQPLEMAGVLEIQATQQGKLLQLAEGLSITVKLAASQSSDQFSVYLNDAEADHWVTANSLYTEGDFTVYADEFYDAVQDRWITAHRFQIPRLGRIASARPIAMDNGTTSVCLEVPEAFRTANTRVFAVITALNSMVPLYLEDGNFCSVALPTGATAEFVLVGAFEDNFYYDRISMDLVHNIQTEVLDPGIYSVDDLIILLSSF